MTLAATICSILLLLASTGLTQIQPLPGAGDPHLQTVDYDSGQIVQLRGAPGYQLMVQLSPDEQVHNVALGDNTAWHVSLSKDSNRLFLKPTSVETSTNMTVVTSVRIYNFDLIAMAAASPDMPYAVEFRYPAPIMPAGETRFGQSSEALRRASHYKIGGDRLLRPASITDDGERTYISWPKGSPIPAVYAPDGLGNEALVNGMMGIDDVYVVDGAPRRLTFRIDRNVAYAERLKRPSRRK